MELFLLSVIQYPHHQAKHILSVYVRSVRVSEGECKEVSVSLPGFLASRTCHHTDVLT